MSVLTFVSPKKKDKADQWNYGFDPVIEDVVKVVNAAPSSVGVSKNLFRAPKKTSNVIIMEEVYSINVTNDPQRSTSNEKNGLYRSNLGEGGTISIFKCLETNCRVVWYRDKNKVKLFESIVLGPADAPEAFF